MKTPAPLPMSPKVRDGLINALVTMVKAELSAKPGLIKVRSPKARRAI